MRLIRAFRPYVDSCPWLGRTYRHVREAAKFHLSSPAITPYGFRICGNTKMIDGSFESLEVSAVLKILPQVEVFVDIGANIGYYSCLARANARKVLAFEPQPNNLRYLRKNLSLNHWNDIEVWPVALGDKTELAHLFGGGTAASRIKGWSDSSSATKLEVLSLRLDDVLRNRFDTQPLFIKMDIEGWEYFALKGATGLFERNPKPIFLVEFSSGEHHPTGDTELLPKSLQILTSHGYQAYSPADLSKPIGLNPEELAKKVLAKAVNQNIIFAGKELNVAGI